MSQMDLQGPGPMQGGGLAAMLGGGGPPPGDPTDQQDTSDPLTHTQDAIDSVHGLMRTLTDPEDVANTAKALTILAGVQKRLMVSGSPAQGR